MTGSAHIITAVIGSGVLSLAWAIAQLGWVAGPAVLMAFSFITYFTSTMLADCYRSPDPVTGKRNYTYMEVVRSYLGPFLNYLIFFFYYFVLESRGIFRYISDIKSQLYTINSSMLFILNFFHNPYIKFVSESFCCSLIIGLDSFIIHRMISKVAYYTFLAQSRSSRIKRLYFNIYLYMYTL